MPVPAIAPVETPIGTEEAAVYIRRVADEAELADDLIADLGDAVVVAILELPDIGRAGDVQRALMPEGARGEGHLVGKDGGLVEAAVAVDVFEPADVVGRLREQLFGIEVLAGALGDVQPAAIVEAGHKRVLDQGRPGRDLDAELVGNLDLREELLFEVGVGLAGQADGSQESGRERKRQKTHGDPARDVESAPVSRTMLHQGGPFVACGRGANGSCGRPGPVFLVRAGSFLPRRPADYF